MKFKYRSLDSNSINQHMSFIKAVCFFGVLFTVLFVATYQLQHQIERNQGENREFDTDTRLVQNDFRNTTLSYLNNLTETINEQGIKITNLENQHKDMQLNTIVTN